MNGERLTFFVHENRRLHGKLLYRWLLDTAQDMGLHGGSAFRAIAGFGRHGVQHEQHFLELAGDVPVAVMFALSTDQVDALLSRVSDEGVPLFYMRTPAEYGVINGGKG
ncbi:hypothetical protein KBTX_04042 [wastewater metagenome]|uniref:Uncharacterized protein n=2 Tax=unclassified sequences TaxID=12908 RepID=A0A5B8RGB9_9ZZZZ|nr:MULTISPECIES: DUF190 domain-containing protein [Arhodomonas]QEA07681.1 hypothetical protein KBTEX_04042 [uncultured organism]